MKPKIGIIGCGYWGKKLVRNCHQLGALNAICDVNPACLQEHLLRHEGIHGLRVLHILEACQDSLENAGVTVKLGYSDKEVAVGS